MEVVSDVGRLGFLCAVLINSYSFVRGHIDSLVPRLPLPRLPLCISKSYNGFSSNESFNNECSLVQYFAHCRTVRIKILKSGVWSAVVCLSCAFAPKNWRKMCPFALPYLLFAAQNNWTKVHEICCWGVLLKFVDISQFWLRFDHSQEHISWDLSCVSSAAR